MKLEKLYHIIPTYLHSAVLGAVKGGRRVKLPDRVGQYRLIKDLQPEKDYPFKIGLYSNRNGKRVVGKIWQGSQKNLHYFDILHEIDAMSTMASLQSRVSEKLPRNLRSIRTPQLIKVISGPGELMYFSEFMKGTPLSKLKSAHQQLKKYEQCVEYLRTLTQYCTPQEKQKLGIKTATDYLWMFPLIFIATIFKRPRRIGLILRGGLVFLTGYLSIRNRPSDSIVHGDLNMDNILLDGKNISILDMEQMTITFPEYELITLISSRRNRRDFLSYIFDDITAKCHRDRKYARVFSTLLVNCSIHNLTGNSIKDNVQVYFRRLDLGIKLFIKFGLRSDSHRQEKRFSILLS